MLARCGGSLTGASLSTLTGHGRGSFVLYRGVPMATLEDFSSLVEGEEVFISGRLHADEATALGLITQGRYGFAPCEPDRRVRYPRFRISCPMPADDEYAIWKWPRAAPNASCRNRSCVRSCAAAMTPV